MGVKDIHPKDTLEVITADFEARTRGETTFTQDISCLRKDGTIVYVDISGSSTVIDGKKCIIRFFRNITERRQAQEDIKKRVKELEEFYDIAVGRELRMIELKKEIAELKGRTGKNKKK